MVSLPSVSYSVDKEPSVAELIPIEEALLKVTVDLLPIQEELITIAASYGPSNCCLNYIITIVLASIRMVSTTSHYEFDLLSQLPLIKEEQKMRKYKYRVEGLTIAKKNVGVELDTLRSYSAPMANNDAVLQQIDKAKDIIRPVLELFDKASAILQYHIDRREIRKYKSETGSTLTPIKLSKTRAGASGSALINHRGAMN
jgi:hypothetical protein